MITNLPIGPGCPGPIFDTHAHYDDAAFDGIRDSLIRELPQQGVRRIVDCGADRIRSQVALRLADTFDFVWAAVGLHPEEVDSAVFPLHAFEPLAQHKKCVAIGEIGLDYHWYPERKEAQKAVFTAQMEWAKALNKPVIVHDREAHEDTLALLKRYRPKGVVHCFSGSVEMANELIKAGFYIGVGGVITFKNAKRLPDVIAHVPLDRLLLETDAPYMAPEPFRGKTNHSGLIPYMAQAVAAIKGVEVSAVYRETYANACRLFGLDP